MNITAVKNSVRSVLDSWDSHDSQVAQIVQIFMVEFWGHTKDEHVTMDMLTDQEFRIISMWVLMTKEAGTYRDRKIHFIKELRETFPGVSLKAAKDFVE